MPSNELGKEPENVFESCIETVTNVSEAFKYQMMNNVECLLDSISDKVERERLRPMFETFFKQPIRRQVGRLNKTAILLRKFSVTSQTNRSAES